MNHDGHDEHDECGGPGLRVERVHAMRIPSPLSSAAERAMTRTIDSAVTVHRSLGPGFVEAVYKKAMCLELDAAGIQYECEKSVDVVYRGVAIHGHRIDLVVERLIVVELKAVARLEDVHLAQAISYLKATGLRGGLLVNFRVTLLHRGLRRIVL